LKGEKPGIYAFFHTVIYVKCNFLGFSYDSPRILRPRILRAVDILSVLLREKLLETLMRVEHEVNLGRKIVEASLRGHPTRNFSIILEISFFTFLGWFRTFSRKLCVS